MKKTITLPVLLCLLVTTILTAQIPNDSPIPVEVRTEAQDGTITFYNYTSAADWLDTLAQTVSGELAWAYGLDGDGMTTDSLLCDTMVSNDLTGKIALIQRGDCEFGWKALRAEEAGAIGAIIINHTYIVDGGGLVNMGGGVYGSEVSIPTIFLTREDGDLIKEKIDNGISMTGFFEVRAFGGARTAYSYHTPIDAVKPMEDIGVTFLNTDESMTIPSVTIDVEITDPSGGTETLTKELTDLPPLSLNAVDFDDAYTPSEVGTYTAKFSNSLTPDEITQDFVITENIFALDNGEIVPNTNGTIEPSDDDFAFLYAFRYDFGNVYRTGPNEVMATHASFMISNPEEILTGDPEADVFNIRLYDADPDGNDSIPYPAEFPDYNGLNENGGPSIPLVNAEYVISDTDVGFEFITVEFDAPVSLGANKMFLLMIEYDGSAAGIGIPPKYAFAGTERMAGNVGTMIFTDMLHTDGWGNNYNGVVRLHLDGFSDTDESPLEEDKLTISPNPASQYLNLNLDLENTAEQITVRILDFNGRLVQTREFEGVQKNTLQLNISDLANGNYFLTVSTPEGYRAKKFQVLH